jgi:hypothetical protein
MITIGMPKWFVKAVNKLRRGYIWKGHEQVNGDSCLIVCDKVQSLLDLRGLGVLNLEYMSWSLQMRWLWFEKTDTSRPWRGLDVKFHPSVVALFKVALQ